MNATAHHKTRAAWLLSRGVSVQDAARMVGMSAHEVSTLTPLRLVFSQARIEPVRADLDDPIAGLAGEIAELDTVSLRRALALCIALVAQREGAAATAEVCNGVIRKLLRGDRRSEEDRAAAIVAEVAAEAGLTVGDLMGATREHRYAHPRQEAWRRIRDDLGWSLPRIGRMFGKDHTTILHGVRAAEARGALRRLLEAVEGAG